MSDFIKVNFSGGYSDDSCGKPWYRVEQSIFLKSDLVLHKDSMEHGSDNFYASSKYSSNVKKSIDKKEYDRLCKELGVENAV